MRGLVDDLLKAGIISEVKKPVKWCTQGFFLENPGAPGKFRLVTGYRELKRTLERLDWPSLSSDYVRRQLDLEMRVFCVFDLCSCYHKIKLAEDHKNLTTFNMDT